MRNNTTLSLNTYLEEMLRDLNRFAVGYEPTMRVLENIRNTSQQGFPPYDLEKVSDTEYRLSMAVAGYTEADLEIVDHDGVLTVSGKMHVDEQKTFLHKGIAGRSFKKSFYLDPYVRVDSSSLEHGVLTINFIKEVPEALKPRKIEIGTSTKPVITN